MINLRFLIHVLFGSLTFIAGTESVTESLSHPFGRKTMMEMIESYYYTFHLLLD